MSADNYYVVLAGVVQGLLSNPKLDIVFPPATGGPPRINSYSIGPDGESQIAADQVLARLAHCITESVMRLHE